MLWNQRLPAPYDFRINNDLTVGGALDVAGGIQATGKSTINTIVKKEEDIVLESFHSMVVSCEYTVNGEITIQEDAVLEVI